MPSANTNRRGRVQTASTNTTKKKKKPLTRAAKLKADKAQRKADFDAHQKAREKKGQGKMTLQQRKDADWKEAQGAAAKKHDAFQKKHKRGKYSKKGVAKAKAADDKKHGITDKDTGLSKFAKKGGIAGGVNRWLKKQRLKVKERGTTGTQNRRGSGARNRR